MMAENQFVLVRSLTHSVFDVILDNILKWGNLEAQIYFLEFIKCNSYFFKADSQSRSYVTTVCRATKYMDGLQDLSFWQQMLNYCFTVFQPSRREISTYEV